MFSGKMKLLLLLLFFGATGSFLWFCLLCLRMIPFSKGEWYSFLHFQCCASVPGITPQYNQLKLQLSKNEILILSSKWKIITNRFCWVTQKPLHIKLLHILMSIQLLNCDNRVLVFTAWKVTVFGVFLVCSFSHLEWIWRDTPYHSVFSPNAGKSWPFHVTGLL